MMDSDDQGVSTPGAALLLIVGEPFSDEQKLSILAEITKGFRCWDEEDTGININEELAQIANRASLGIEGLNGERLIQHQSENLAVEILINPLAQSVKASIKKLLVAPAETKYIIYAGHAFQGSGAWVLQDDTFSFSHLAQVFKNVDVENALKQNIEASLTIHTLADSNWGTYISKADFTNNLRIQLNPPEKLHNIHGVLQFTAYVGGFLRVVPITSLLQASEQFGNISFTRPTLYIFPGCQGDSALFGINGFNLLVNGGYNRRACFWDFARHLDRLDAMLVTHLGTDNIFGLSSVLQRKSLENIHPQIGYLYFNAPEKAGISSSGEGDDVAASKNDSLLVNLAEEANKTIRLARQLGISPYPCSRSATAAVCEPVNLYHKLGHGSLDMYVLNPVSDSKELKDFYLQWGKAAASLDAGGPLSPPNVLSVCALLVWKPYNLDEKIVRILFPGNAPQHKVIEGFEKLKTFGFLKLPSCTTRDLMKPPPVKKPPPGLSRPGSSGGRGQVKAPASARSETARGLNTRVESPRKETKPAPSKTEAKPSSPTKPPKTVKDENRRNVKERPKVTEKETKPKSVPTKEDEKQIRDKAKPLSGPSPLKTTPSSKSPSPPKSLSPPKSPTKTKAPAAAAEKVEESKSVAAAAPADQSGSGDTLVNHVGDQKREPQQEQVRGEEFVKASQSPESSISEARDAVGAVDDVSTSVSTTVDKQKLQDFGIYDEDQKADFINGRDSYETEEEEKPQALPEPPIMVDSPSLELDSMPDYTSKIESDEQELSEFSRAEEELLELESRGETSYDPAEEIPMSPEPSQQDQQEYQYPSSVKPQANFETPFFTNDVSDLLAGENPSSMEHNIQYGIDDSSNGRDMGGIQEVDEDEDESSAVAEDGRKQDCDTKDSGSGKIKTNALRQGLDEGSAVMYSEADSQQVHRGLDEGIEDDDSSYLPRAPNKETKSEVETLDDQGSVESGDRDTLDGDVPDDKTAYTQVNGGVFHGAGEISQGSNQKSSGADTLIGLDGQTRGCADEGSDDEHVSFDPLKQWGQPMGLPSPQPADNPAAGEGKKGATTKANGTDKRPVAASTPKSGTSSQDTRAARHASAPPDAKKRPTAAASANKGASRPGSASKRPGTASARAASTAKAPALPPLTPFYVDLTYIPSHGDSAFCDVEFFKRIRACNYVISSLSPNAQVLDSLLEAKESWEQKDLEVTIIPTYDNETLRHWMGLNTEKLQELRVDLAPAVSRCTIKLQDLETSLPAFRLEV